MQDQPMDDPAAQMERELRAAQEQVRELGDILRAALAEDDRLAQQTNHPAPQASQSPQDHRPTTRDEH